MYQTRAERDRNAAYGAERSAGSAYAPKSSYADFASSSAYRRPLAYEPEPTATANSDYLTGTGYGADPYFAGRDRFRPVTRRLSNTGRDSGRARSQSNDRKFSTSSVTDLDPPSGEHRSDTFFPH